MADGMTTEISAADGEGNSTYLNPRTLEEYKRMFEAFRSATQDNRAKCLEDDDYYHGQQLSPTEKATLKGRGQPIVEVNRIRTAVNGIMGVFTRGQSEPRAFPRTPKDEDSADVATDALRFISDKSRLGAVKARVFKNFLVEGTGAVLTTVNNDYEVIIEKIRWEEFFYDPRSREEDFSDARYMGIAKWMYQDDAAKMFPKHREALLAAVGNGVGGAGSFLLLDESFSDRPDQVMSWIDSQQNRILIVEVYHKYMGEWHRCCYYGQGILDAGPSPYMSEKGRPSNPIEACSAYVNRSNDRYGVVRDMKAIQDEINKRRSKLLHLLNSTQIQAEDPAAIETSTEEVRKEAARPDGVLPFGWRKVSTTDMSAGQSALLAESKNELERMSPNPAILGRQGADTSGRALLARQQAGLVELDVILSAFDDWELRVYRQAWARAKQFWTEPMWIRVTDDEDAPKFVHINKPKEPPPELAAMMGGSAQPPQMGPDGQPMPTEAPAHQFPPGLFGYENAIADMDIDITVETTPETATIRAEMVKDLKDIIATNPAYAQQVPFEIFVELSPLPKKRQLMAKIGKAKEESAKAQAENIAHEKAIAHGVAQAKVDESQSKVVLNEASALAQIATAQEKGLTSFGDAMLAIHQITEAEKAPPPGETGGPQGQPVS